MGFLRWAPPEVTASHSALDGYYLLVGVGFLITAGMLVFPGKEGWRWKKNQECHRGHLNVWGLRQLDMTEAPIPIAEHEQTSQSAFGVLPVNKRAHCTVIFAVSVRDPASADEVLQEKALHYA